MQNEGPLNSRKKGTYQACLLPLGGVLRSGTRNAVCGPRDASGEKGGGGI